MPPRKPPVRVLTTRPPLTRMLAFHRALQADALPTAIALAKQFEVSERTVRRDLDYMRDQLGLPIAWNPSRRGFEYTSAVLDFPGLSIDEGELFALLVAQKTLEAYRGTTLFVKLQRAFERLRGSLSDQISFSSADALASISIRPLGTATVDAAIFDTLTRALVGRRVLRLKRQPLGGEKPVSLTLHPLHLSNVDGAWYLLAQDAATATIRAYNVSRLLEVEALGHRFEPIPNFDPAEYFKASFWVFTTQDAPLQKVVIKFTGLAADLVREREWHPSQKMKDQPKGGLMLTLQLGNLNEISGWILRWGAEAEVVKPAALRKTIEQTAQALVRTYA